MLAEPAEREARSTDFGGIYAVTPELVLEPACVEDVQAALRFAGEQELVLGARGAGHSQSGQGLSPGLLLDMTALHRVGVPDPKRRLVEVEAGASWRAVVDITFGAGLLPLALTHALDTTVGGTLSIGGIGAMAWSHGPQVDHVAYLDVVTASGDLVRCSLENERELFDAVRAGLGQCGVIVRAGISLRPCEGWVETRTFVYPELTDLLSDARKVAEDPARHRMLAVHVAPDPLRSGRLIAVLLVGHDVANADSSRDRALPPLHHAYEPPLKRTATWSRDGCPGHPFFRVFGNSGGAAGPSRKNPWVDFLYPVSMAPSALATLAADPEHLLRNGPTELMFVRRGANPAPLLVTPAGDDLVVGVGKYATFTAEDAVTAAETMGRYARAMATAGGKRYLCGYFGPTEASDWAEHYGPVWSWFCAAKTERDPKHRFGSPLIRWPFGRA